MSSQLTDASFVVCGQPSAGTEHEQTVPLGTHCLQGEPGIKVDAIIGSPATTTRVFTQASDFNAPKYTNSTGAAAGSATGYGTGAVTGTGSVGNSAADTSGAAATKAISTVLPSMGSTGFATSALATGAGFAPSDGAWVASPISDASSALKVSAASLLVV